MQKTNKTIITLLILSIAFIARTYAATPLYWWEPENETSNFGDQLSIILIEKMAGKKIEKANLDEHKVLALGSILHFAKDGDIVWGSGINGKHTLIKDYQFKKLDVRSVRGPLTRLFLTMMGIEVPEIYGDPALLLPLFFPELKKDPKIEFIVIPHISETHLFTQGPHVIFPSEPWEKVVQKILESQFVISSSLHGVIVAEAFGIPARLLKITDNEPLFKYTDYYLGTGRPDYSYATSVTEALRMRGEPLPKCNLQNILDAFPKELL